MKANYLFPNRFKKIGWFLFIPSVILGMILLTTDLQIDFFNVKVIAILADPKFLVTKFFTITRNNILDEITGILLIVGALFIAFSKEKSEDEFIAKIRLESLVWATYVNYAILIFTIIFIYDFSFFTVLVCNMFTILIFFVIRFNWALYKSKNQLGDEE